VETEWDFSGRKRGRDGQKKKIGKANQKRKKRKSKKGANDEEVKGQRGKGVPRAHTGQKTRERLEA